jgi:hypothetical protein
MSNHHCATQRSVASQGTKDRTDRRLPRWYIFVAETGQGAHDGHSRPRTSSKLFCARMFAVAVMMAITDT